MISKYIRTALSLLLSLMAICVTAQNTIMLRDTLINTSAIDCITFDTSQTPPMLIARDSNKETSIPLLNNASIPFFSGLDLTGTIYETSLTDQIWTLYYLTPIGYFYCAPINSLLDSEEQEPADTRLVWFYQTFDTLEWAFITTDANLSEPENVEYPGGDFSLYYTNPKELETTHFTTDGSLREASFPYKEFNPATYTILLQKMIHCLTEILSGYSHEPQEEEFAILIEKFKKLLTMPVVQTSLQDTFTKGSAHDFAKKKVSDRNFTIYPVTGTVNDIFDGYVGRVEGRLNCASHDYKKNAEYGIVYATSESACVVGKGNTVKARQDNLKLTFATELENLTPGTTYYYRTYAKISPADKNKYSFKYEYAGSDIGYGKIKKFTTAKYCKAKVTYWILNNPYWSFNTEATVDLKYLKNETTGYLDYRINCSRKDHIVMSHEDGTKPARFSLPLSKEDEMDNYFHDHCHADLGDCAIDPYRSSYRMTLYFRLRDKESRTYIEPSYINCDNGCIIKDTEVVTFTDVEYKYEGRILHREVVSTDGKVSCKNEGKRKRNVMIFRNYKDYYADYTEEMLKNFGIAEEVPLTIGIPTTLNLINAIHYPPESYHIHKFNHHYDTFPYAVLTESGKCSTKACPFYNDNPEIYDEDGIKFNFNIKFLIDLVPVF